MSFNMSDKKIVSGQEMGDNSIVFDINEGDVTNTLPNACDILDTVISILECMNTPEMKQLRETDFNMFEQLMEEKYLTFADRYYNVFKMVLSGEDITPLFQMLQVINDVKIGRTDLESGEQYIGQCLTKFLPKDLLHKLESGELTENDIKANYV